MGPFSMVEIVFALWIVTASIVVVVMVRRGHDAPRWAIISFALAPIAPLLASFARYQARATKDTIVEAGEPGEGPLGVLVGIDGSPEATDALRGTLELLANRIGRLHLATVVDYETASNKRRPDRKSADANLAAAAQLASQTSAVGRQRSCSLVRLQPLWSTTPWVRALTCWSSAGVGGVESRGSREASPENCLAKPACE